MKTSMEHTEGTAVKRAENMVWTAAGDYGFEPEFLAFCQDGQPDVYLNSIIGYAHKWFGTAVLETLTEPLKHTLRRETYEGLLWFAIENCVYEREVRQRPLLEELRRDYALRFFEQERLISRQQWMSQDSTVYALWEARCRGILGRDAGPIRPGEQELFRLLTCSGNMTDQEVADRITEVFRAYFHYTGQPDRITAMYRVFGRLRRRLREKIPMRIIRRETLQIAGGSPGSGPGYAGKKAGLDIGAAPGARDTDRDYMEYAFGAPLYPHEKELRLNALLCTGAHSNCRLYYTEGKRESYEKKNPGILQLIWDAEKQRHSNEEFFREHRQVFQHAVARLTEQIRNAILTAEVPLPLRGRSGRLAAPEVWRALLLDDDRVFWETMEEERPEFSVDLLLDASASCRNDQEMISAQGYVLAKSLQNCSIPVQVTAFSSLRGYTVLRRFAGYDEPGCIDRIFSYFTAGWNRDGLALRGILPLMEDGCSQNRLLIILTDASPNDDRKIPLSAGKGILTGRDYSGKAGTEDTAAQVRALEKQGIHVMAILNGAYSDTEAARRIYGRNFVRIEEPGQLAAAAGRLLQKKILEHF